MKKNIFFSFVLIFLSLNAFSKNIEVLKYVKTSSSHSDIFFENDLWISKEKITIENPTDCKIIFEIEGVFSKDYKNKNIADTKILKGYADKNKKERFFEIESNTTKQFDIYFIGKNTGKNQKYNRLPVENVLISQINGTIKLLETDYIIKKRNTDRIELEIKNKQIISIFQNYNLLTIELDSK